MQTILKENPVVNVEHVGFSYPNRGRNLAPVLSDVGLTINRKEWVGVIGPSGCGKSTLLKLIAGLESAQTGTLDVFGNAPARAGAAHRIGVAFQEQALIPWLSARRNVELPARGRIPDALNEAGALLSAFGLSRQLETLPSELSGGMRARVALARALIHRPELILLDEPFSSLDEITAIEVCRELLAWRKRGAPSLLFISHNLEAVARLADKCLCFIGHQAGATEVVDLQRFGDPGSRTEEQVREARACLLSRYV